MAVAWKDREALHQPEWPDRARLEEVKRKLHALPPLVFAGEARQVRAALADVAAGRAFLLQAGGIRPVRLVQRLAILPGDGHLQQCRRLPSTE